MLTVVIVVVLVVVVVVVVDERWWEIIQSVDYVSLTVHTAHDVSSGFPG